MAQHASEIPLLIVGTYRDVDLEVARPFAKMLEAFTRQRLAHKVALRRLPEANVSDMLQALSGQAPPNELVSAIYAETEGNPFFVEEVFQHLSEEERLFDDDGRWRGNLRVEELEVPEGVRLVIGRRVERLSSEARQVLTTAAVVGRSFDLTLLDALGDAEGDALLTALEEAEAARLIQAVASGREVRWEFSHGLIRQTLENSLSLMRRQRAHLRVAETLERVYGEHVERHASDLAQHLYQAGMGADPDKTVRFLTLAGDQALNAGTFDEALRQFTEAVSIQEDQEDRRALADLHYKRGLALRSVGRIPEAVAALQPAFDIFAELRDAEGVARTTIDMADQTSWVQGGPRAAPGVARRGLAAVGESDTGARCLMLAVLARFSSLAGEPYEVAHEALKEAESLAAELDRPELTAEALTARTRFHWSYAQFPEGIEVGRRAAAVRNERGEEYEEAENYLFVMGMAWGTGRFDDVDEVSALLGPLAERRGHFFATWFMNHVQNSKYLVTSGDLAGTIERCRRLREWSGQNAPLWRGFNDGTRAAAHFFAGDWSAARDVFAEAVRLEPGSFLDGLHESMGLAAGAYAGDDVLSGLLTGHASAMKLAEDNRGGLWEVAVNVAEGLAVLGRKTEAADLHRFVVRGIEKGCCISLQSWRLWQMVAGIAAACGQHWDAAQEHYEKALTQAHDLPHKIAQPEVRRWYAQMLLDRNQAGDRDKARTLLGEAIAQYRTIGMPKHLAMAEGMLKRV